MRNVSFRDRIYDVWCWKKMMLLFFFLIILNDSNYYLKIIKKNWWCFQAAALTIRLSINCIESILVPVLYTAHRLDFITHDNGPITNFKVCSISNDQRYTSLTIKIYNLRIYTKRLLPRVEVLELHVRTIIIVRISRLIVESFRCIKFI